MPTAKASGDRHAIPAVAGNAMHPEPGSNWTFGRLCQACIVLSIGFLAVAAAGAVGSAAAWRDSVTGLAIGGYDPVSYFVSRSARRGRERHELVQGGSAWRFVNSGNQAAFAAAPEVYSPRYQGYDPVALAQGGLSQGEPLIWSLHKGALYLFQNPVNRLRWLESPDSVRKEANRAWPRLSRTLPQLDTTSR